MSGALSAMGRAAATEPAPRPVGEIGRLARDLARRVAFALPRLDDDARALALAAVDAFLAAPSPARHLAAARLLGELARRAAAARLGRSTAARRLDDARAALPRTTGLDPALVTALAGGESADAIAALADADPRAALRLEALAALVEAQHLISTRVAEAAAEMRRQLDSSRAAAAAPAREPTRVARRPRAAAPAVGDRAQLRR